MKILLIGQGHGFQALINGFSNSKYQISVLLELNDELITNSDFTIINSNLSPELAKEFSFVISSGYRKWIPSDTLSASTFINIHYALFPKYRGMHSIVWAIINGETNVGVTVHLMDEGLDSGPIIWQKSIEILEKTSWEIMLDCDQLVTSCIDRVFEDYLGGVNLPIPQNEHDAFYVGKRNRKDCQVDWDTWDIVTFERALKALVAPYPLPFFEFSGKYFEIAHAEIIKKNYIEINGHVVHISRDFVQIKIPGGLINLFELIDPIGRRVSAKKVLGQIGIRLAQ
jgi:methionyl-tRNA formyltransferase